MAAVTQKGISQLTWVVISGLGFVLFVAAAVVLINFSNQTGNIKPQIFFFLLVMIGLIASGFLFGGLKSHAKYSGKVYNGTLELGGPTVLFILIIYMGFRFSASAPQYFTLKFTVFGTSTNDELVNAGMVKVLFNKPDSGQISNGNVSFTDVPTGVQGKKITVIPVAPGYYTAAQEILVPDGTMPVALHLKKKPDSLSVSGIVIDVNGQPVAGAAIVLADGLFNCKADQYGNFRLTLPYKDGAEIPIRVYQHNKLHYNNMQVLSAKVPLTLQLH